MRFNRRSLRLSLFLSGGYTGSAWAVLLVLLGILIVLFMLGSYYSRVRAPEVLNLRPSETPSPIPTLTATQEGQLSPTSSPSSTMTTIPPLTFTPSLEVLLGYTSTPPASATPSPTMFATEAGFFEGPISIGNTVEGRPLEAFRFGTGPDNRLIVAGVHGGYEWNTVALADELIQFLQINQHYIPNSVTLFIIRNHNPDGYAFELSSRGRANANGVDLNRNYPIYWQAEWDRTGCFDYQPTTAGDWPGSEPETQVIMSFIIQIQPTALISYHSAALGIFPAANGESVNTPDADSYRLAEALGVASTYPFPPVETECIYTGTLPDFAASVGVAAVDVELHTHEETDFHENLEILKAFLAWTK